MGKVSLFNYEKPRVLTIDFTQQSVDKIRQAGYNVRRGYTGILKEDQNMFNMPCSIGDVEIVLFYIRKDTIPGLVEREISHESIEKEIDCLSVLLEDVWRRNGVCIIIIEPDVNPTDLNILGIKFFGVANYKRKFFPASSLTNVVEELKKLGNYERPPDVVFPVYKGEDFNLSDHPIARIYENYLQHGKHIIMCTNTNDIRIFNYNFNEYPARIFFHVRDNSSEQYPLCLELTDRGAKHSIIVFPSFGKKTDDAVIDILNDHIKNSFEHLFSQPNFVWLENYRPEPVQMITDEREQFIEEAMRKISEFDSRIESTLQDFVWMDTLLTGKDEPDNEPFKDAIIQALNFLGFTVIDVDASLPEGEPRREDLNIIDEASEYFALGEVKTTEAGAKEQMYRDLNKHLMRYIRETGDVRVRGLLFVNNSIKLDPLKRHDFYKHEHIQDELNDSKSTAVDSYYLHQLCQKVLKNDLTSDEARKIIMSGKEVLSLQ